MKFISRCLIPFALIFSLQTSAEQSKQIGSLDVHYSAFNSTFIPPKVAVQYGLTRSKVNALLNIAILDRNQAGKPAISAKLSGTAKNSRQQKKSRIQRNPQGQSIYYLAEMPFDDQENYVFDIDINAQGNRAGKLPSAAVLRRLTILSVTNSVSWHHRCHF